MFGVVLIVSDVGLKSRAGNLVFLCRDAPIV